MDPLVHRLGLRRRLLGPGHQLKPHQEQQAHNSPSSNSSSSPSPSSSLSSSYCSTLTPKPPRSRSRRDELDNDHGHLSPSSPLLPAPPAKPIPSTLLHLPTELHLMITSHLNYPDALSLKHTTRYFYHLVDTNIALKVEWLLERRRLHLECPNEQRCDLGSDLRFCKGSVRLLMQRRREHAECESRPDLGCLVFGTKKCLHRPKFLGRLQRWLGCRISIEIGCWKLLAMLSIVGGWLWLTDVLSR